MNKRILIFSLQYYPLVGGAEVAIKEITDRIPSDEIEFHMLTLRFTSGAPREEKIGNVVVHRVGTSGSYIGKVLFVPRAAFAAYRLHRRLSFSGAWAMMTYMVFPLVLLRIFGVRIPYALTLQDGDQFERVFRRWYVIPFLPLLRYGFRHASVISVLSTYLASWVRRVGYREDALVIPNAADVRHFENATPLDVGKKRDEVWLVTSSRLVHKNAIDDVIRALPLLPSSTHFLILGVGEEEAKLRTKATSLGLDTRVHFMGYVAHDRLPGYLKACDIFVRPSRSEGFGASFPEAMAAGLPVIATQEGGIADFLFDAKRNPNKETTGWAVDKNSPEQIAAAVNDILANPEQVKKVTETAKRMVLEKYDWDLIAKDMRDKVFGILL